LLHFPKGVHQVNGRQVRAAIRDAQFQRIDGPARARWLMGRRGHRPLHDQPVWPTSPAATMPAAYRQQRRSTQQHGL
jgi:hypothetical protein